MRRAITTLTAVLTGAAALAVVPVGLPSAVGEGDPTMALSVPEGPTGTVVDVTGQGCFLADGTTGSDGVLVRFIAPDGTTATSATLPVERDGTWAAPFEVPAGVPAATYSVTGTCIAPMVDDLGVVTAGTFTVTGEGSGARTAAEREEATPRSARQIEPYPAYDGQSRCSPAAKPGMVGVRDMVLRAYPRTTSFGISRDCGIGGTSEHKEGRAWDWGVDATTTAGRNTADRFFQWLFRTDQYGHRHAMARRLGVMYIIWNRRIFRMYRPEEGWTPYSGSSPHTDHVHISLTRQGGAKQTSFWTLGLPGPGGGGNPPPPQPPPPPRPDRGPRAEFDQTERDVRKAYDHAAVADFDGDGRNDVLWYGSGPRPEQVWWGRAARRNFTPRDLNVRGRYRPQVGDFDGDGRHDVLWYSPEPGGDRIWFGRANRRWTARPITVTGRFARSTVGDFDGDGRDDIFWYGPNGGRDRLWFGKANRTFAIRTLDVGGSSVLRSGDFDGDGRDDVLLFGRGDAVDGIWFGRRDRTFDQSLRSIGQTTQPIVGDLDGDGRADIFWYAPGPAGDKVWWGRGNRTFLPGSVANVAGRYAPAFAGDLDDDGDDDIFWYRAGAPRDYVWWFK